MCKSLRTLIASSVSQWDIMNMSVTVLTSLESTLMTLIWYKMMHKATMDMATMVVTQVEVNSKVMVVFLEEVAARLFAIIAIKQDM